MLFKHVSSTLRGGHNRVSIMQVIHTQLVQKFASQVTLMYPTHCTLVPMGEQTQSTCMEASLQADALQKVQGNYNAQN